MVQIHVRVLLFHCVIIFYCLIVLVTDTQQRCAIVMMVGGALPPCILKMEEMENLYKERMELQDELNEVLQMSDEEVCKKYNSDDKNEIVIDIKRDIANVDEDIKEHYSECSGTLDEAYSSYSEYYQFI